MFEKFDIEDKNIFKVCVVATMSSGKSTFINSIIGEEVVPEKNEACTARTMAVLNNDLATVKKVHIIRKSGDKEVVEIDSRDVLEQVNNDEDVVDFLVETNIQSIDNMSRALMVIDTPGVNNSEDERHGERTEEFLNQMDMGVIIYLLNATQLATNDDSILLQLVCEHIKKQSGNVKIMFVINKIDALDLETESISGTVKIAKEYIEQHGIENPVIYPLSALAAKTLRMALYKREMTRRELRKLEDIYEHYQSKDNDMLAYAMTDELSDELYEIGDLQVSAQKLQRAIDNTGISAVEKKIDSFMREFEQRYAPEIVIKSQLTESTAQEYQKRLEKLVSFPRKIDWKRFKSTNDLVENNLIIQNLNRQLQNFDEVEFEINMTDIMNLSSCDINVLIKNIEEIKSTAFDIFKTGTYMGVKREKGVYFSPGKNLDKRISVKNFYLMSEDCSSWKSIHFGRLTNLIESGKEVYLYSEYSTLLFTINSENSTDVVALLDTKIPIRIIKIAGLNAEQVTLDKVIKYIEKIENDAEKRRKEIEAAEDQLKRTYKGIVFNTEKLKMDIIQKEQALLEYCTDLDQRTHSELWFKKKEVSQLPNSIFSEFVSKLISALAIQENREKNALLNKIELANIDILENILKDLKKEHYSENVNNQIIVAIDERRIICQKNTLDEIINDYEKHNRDELRDLIAEIKNKKFNAELTDKYIKKLEKQIEFLEMKELRELCVNIEDQSIESLHKLEKTIRNGNYQDQFTNQYYKMISARMEFLHVRNLEQICSSVSSVDRNALLFIENKIKEEDCSPILKERFLNLVEQQKAKLDYNDLCELTKDLQTKQLNDIEEIYQKLQSGKYNEKYVKTFLLKCRICLELAQQENINSMVSSLNQMNKTQCIDVLQKIEKSNYDERICWVAKKKIEERIYELDMLELMSINNEFNSLSLVDIQNLRRLIQQKSVCNRAIETYQEKLTEREIMEAYRLVSPLSCLVKQGIDAYGLSNLNISIATFSPEYLQLLRNHFDELGREEYEEIPAFFYPECSKLAISKNYLYCYVGTDYSMIRLSEIRAFRREKRLFKETISINLANGNILTLYGGLNKKNSQAFVAFLTFVRENTHNNSLLAQYQPYLGHVNKFSHEQFEMIEGSQKISENIIIEIFISQLESENVSKIIDSIKYERMYNWTNYYNKAVNMMGINNDRLIFYHDNTLLGSAKDGFAIGVQFIHIKPGQQALISIPINNIFNIKLLNNKLVITTQDNNIFTTDFYVSDGKCKKQMVEWIAEYIKGMQLVNNQSGNIKLKTISYEKLTENNIITCPNCNGQLKTSSKFCPQCGIKVAANDEDNHVNFIFCLNCGNKVLKGKNFCSQCGAKMEG